MPTHTPSLVNTKSRRKTSAAANSIFIPRSFFNRKFVKETSAPKSISALNASRRRTANNPALHDALRILMITWLRGKPGGMDVSRVLNKVQHTALVFHNVSIRDLLFDEIWKNGPFVLEGSRLKYVANKPSHNRNDVNAAHRGHSTISQANGGLPDSQSRAMTRSPVIGPSETTPFYESPGDDVIMSDPSPNQALYDSLMLLIATSGVEAYPLSRIPRQLTDVYSNKDFDYALSHRTFTVSAGFVTYNPSKDNPPKDDSPTRPERYHNLVEFAKKHGYV